MSRAVLSLLCASVLLACGGPSSDGGAAASGRWILLDSLEVASNYLDDSSIVRADSGHILVWTESRLVQPDTSVRGSRGGTLREVWRYGIRYELDCIGHRLRVVEMVGHGLTEERLVIQEAPDPWVGTAGRPARERFLSRACSRAEVHRVIGDTSRT